MFIVIRLYSLTNIVHIKGSIVHLIKNKNSRRIPLQHNSSLRFNTMRIHRRLKVRRIIRHHMIEVPIRRVSNTNRSQRRRVRVIYSSLSHRTRLLIRPYRRVRRNTLTNRIRVHRQLIRRRRFQTTCRNLHSNSTLTRATQGLKRPMINLINSTNRNRNLLRLHTLHLNSRISTRANTNRTRRRQLLNNRVKISIQDMTLQRMPSLTIRLTYQTSRRIRNTPNR